MAKQQYATPVMANDALPGEVTVEIAGMRQIGPDTFVLSGVEQRVINWTDVAHSLGFEGDIPDSLADEIASAVWKHDVREVLVARMKRA